MKDHEVAQLVNGLREIAVEYGQTQQLRERIATYVVPAFYAALKAERARCCAEIKAADDKASEDDYMLDSNDCISVIRGTWKGAE